jgi:hypothetical protein
MTTTIDPTNLEFAKKFVANNHWRWPRGMVIRYPNLRPDETRATIVKIQADCIEGETPIAYENGITRFGWDPQDGWLPDLDASATLGCIEHEMVPAALQDPDAFLCFDRLERNWYVYSPKHDECTTSKGTKPAALLAALDEADDIVRRSGESAPVVEEDFGDPDERDDYDGGSDRDDHDDWRYVPEPDEVPTDPKLCTRPAPAQTVVARNFLETLRQRDAEREAQRIAKLRAKEISP